MMEIELHNDFSAVDSTQWNALLDRSVTDVPFLRHGYLSAWWQHKGGGEWPEDSQLALITGKINNELSALAPFFITREKSILTIRLLGSVEISDYLDCIAPAEVLPGFVAGIFSFLNNSSELKMANFSLINIPATSPTLQAFQTEAQKNGFKVTLENAYHTPIITLSSEWDAYLAGIDKKQRHEIRRKLRRADESAEVSWGFCENSSNLDDDIEAFFKLMILDEDKKIFLTQAMRDQMRAIIHWAADEGILKLSFLSINGQKAAAYLCFDYNKHMLVYNSGFDFQFSQYSPGWVLLGYLIQDAIQSGKHYFDFMRGDEDYKYRFGAQDGFVKRLEISRS